MRPIRRRGAGRTGLERGEGVEGVFNPPRYGESELGEDAGY